MTGLELIVGIEQFQNAYTSILTAVLASLFASFYFKKSLSRTLLTTSSIVGHAVLYIFKHTPEVPSQRNTFQWFFFSSTVNSFPFLTIYNDIASYNILQYYSTKFHKNQDCILTVNRTERLLRPAITYSAWVSRNASTASRTTRACDTPSPEHFSLNCSTSSFGRHALATS